MNMKRTSHDEATATLPSDRELELTRTFDAPLAPVWRAWTDPRHVGAW